MIAATRERWRCLTDESSRKGANGRFVRRRLLGGRAQREEDHGRVQGATRRFRLHGQRSRGVPLLLQQRDVHLRREDGGLRDSGTACGYFIPHTHLPVWMLSHSLAPGRERAARSAPLQTRHVAGTDLRARRVDFQAVRPALDHQPQPKVLSHEGEPQFQYGSQHGEEDLQL